MKNLSRHLEDPRRTPQSRPIPGRESEMERNRAGGYVFRAGDWERLDRFLVIGTEGGTYYASERELTVEAAAVVRRCLAVDHERVVRRAMEVSVEGIAPRNDPAILALAMAFAEARRHREESSVRLRRDALRAICRTGTHLFQFLEAVRSIRGDGRALLAAVREWIDSMPIHRLALQTVKYRRRAGWDWRHLSRVAHPKPPAADVETREALARRALYARMAGKEHDTDNLPPIAYHADQVGRVSPSELAEYVRQHRLPWEAVPSEQGSRPDVLEALFESMPLMATIRQLSRLQARGVLDRVREAAIERITSEEGLRRARIHPVALLMAAAAYESGRGRERRDGRDTMTWTPDARIVDALDDAFQAALRVAEPTGKRILVAIDVSGSMRAPTLGDSRLRLWQVAAAMALTYVRTDAAQAIAFDLRFRGSRSTSIPGSEAGVYPLPISPRQRVVDVVRQLERRGGGGTDCSLPFDHALEHGIEVDAFVVLTDNETWAGYSHPAQALRAYRERVNPQARVAWCAMTAGAWSMGDPEDALMLSVSGWDASAPRLVGDFVAGRF